MQIWKDQQIPVDAVHDRHWGRAIGVQANVEEEARAAWKNNESLVSQFDHHDNDYICSGL